MQSPTAHPKGGRQCTFWVVLSVPRRPSLTLCIWEVGRESLLFLTEETAIVGDYDADLRKNFAGVATAQFASTSMVTPRLFDRTFSGTSAVIPSTLTTVCFSCSPVADGSAVTWITQVPPGATVVVAYTTPAA